TDTGGGDDTPAPMKSVATDDTGRCAGAGGDCSITINSIPWSEVWIDGKNTTKHTPVVDYKAPRVPHNLAFKRPDMHDDQTRRINYLPEVVERARARHPEIGFEVGDIVATAAARIEPAASGTWDAVICDRLCHSVVDIKALLLGLKRQLAPGGRIYMTAFNYMW